ncbi:MAG: LssY C-terminal domain-containing protein [Xanthobacteraceae bacterium]|nr:LssY C-terminal domain-containing protein [Xanthobacteraceae bacterium]
MSRRTIAVALLASAAVLYGLAAYVVAPAIWSHYEHQRGLSGLSMLTRTREGIPGDPINVGLVGSKTEVLCAMHAAGWYPADPITLRSSVEIVGSVLLDLPYRSAPVSNLYFRDRREDLAFEKPVGRSADRRNHVRFWRVIEQGQEGRNVWLGSATLDRGVGFSRDTGQITHHIDPDIDAERAALMSDLDAAKVVEASYEVTGIGPTMWGRNCEGDSYYTDGDIEVARLVAGCDRRAEAPVHLESPTVVKIKNWVWRLAANLFAAGASRTAPDVGR